MRMLSEDDVNLRELSVEELDAAWDLWFDTAQTTNEADPPYSHGVFAGCGPRAAPADVARDAAASPPYTRPPTDDF